MVVTKYITLWLVTINSNEFWLDSVTYPLGVRTFCLPAWLCSLCLWLWFVVFPCLPAFLTVFMLASIPHPASLLPYLASCLPDCLIVFFLFYLFCYFFLLVLFFVFLLPPLPRSLPVSLPDCIRDYLPAWLHPRIPTSPAFLPGFLSTCLPNCFFVFYFFCNFFFWFSLLFCLPCLTRSLPASLLPCLASSQHPASLHPCIPAWFPVCLPDCLIIFYFVSFEFFFFWLVILFCLFCLVPFLLPCLPCLPALFLRASCIPTSLAVPAKKLSSFSLL